MTNKRNDILERKNEILVWIEDKKSKAEMCRILLCKPETLDSYLKKFNVEYKGLQGWSKGKRSCRRKSAYEMLESKHISAHKLRKKLLEDGIKEHQCEICKKYKWMNKPIPLELDHIDGNRYNFNLSNLRIICPNCHAQTETNSGKNVGNYKKRPNGEMVNATASKTVEETHTSSSLV